MLSSQPSREKIGIHMRGFSEVHSQWPDGDSVGRCRAVSTENMQVAYRCSPWAGTEGSLARTKIEPWLRNCLEASNSPK